MKWQTPSFLGLFVVLAVPLFAACGSDVTSNNNTGGGGGAGGGGPTLTGLEACSDACHQFDVAGCFQGMPVDCTMSCMTSLEKIPAQCDDVLAKLWVCTKQGVPTCDNSPVVCDALQQDADKCIQTYGCAPDSTCFGGGGMNGEMTCGCESVCKNKKYKTDCTIPASGAAGTCNCFIDDVSVGMCTMMVSSACGVDEDCCNTQFFKL